MKPPRPAHRIALRAGAHARDERLLEVADALHPLVEGRTLALGDRVEAAPGLPLVVEAAEPREGPVTVGPRTVLEVTRRAPAERQLVYDLAFLVDASYSMGRGDVAPSRFEHAGRSVEAFVRCADDFARRAAVAAVTHEPRVVQPLAPLGEVEARGLAAVTPRGRARLADGVAAAVELLQYEGDPGRHRAVVLVTDGASRPRGLLEAAERAGRLDVALHTVALLEGAPHGDALREAAGASGGSHHEGADLGPVFEQLAHAVGAQSVWRAPARPADPSDEVEFEVVIRSYSEPEEAQ